MLSAVAAGTSTVRMFSSGMTWVCVPPAAATMAAWASGVVPGTNHTMSPPVVRLTEAVSLAVGPALRSDSSEEISTLLVTAPAATSAALTVWVQVYCHCSPGWSVQVPSALPDASTGSASQTRAVREIAVRVTLPVFRTENV